MKTDELTGCQLDYWVARAEGFEYVDVPPDADGKNAGRALLPPGLLASGWTFPLKGPVGDFVPRYSSNWELAGQIIEREAPAEIVSCANGKGWYVRSRHLPCDGDQFYGETLLIAAMRAYVASKFGGEVPDNEPLK